MRDCTVKWRDPKRRRPKEFISVLGLLKDAEEGVPMVRECFYVPASERDEVYTPKRTDEDFFEPLSGYWFPALHSFCEIEGWAPMPNPKNAEDDLYDD